MGMRKVMEVRQEKKLYAQTKEGRNREFQKKMQSSANSISLGELLEEDRIELSQDKEGHCRSRG